MYNRPKNSMDVTGIMLARNLNQEKILQPGYNDQFVAVLQTREIHKKTIHHNEISNEIENECDILHAILQCRSKYEAESIVEEYVGNELMDVNNSVYTNIKSVQIIKANNLTGVDVVTVSSNQLLVKFLPTIEGQSPTDCLVMLTYKNKFKYVRSCLPNCVPINNLDAQYLGRKYDIERFLSSIKLYLRAYWRRVAEIQIIKSEGILSASVWHHNENRTVISFSMKIGDSHDIEFCLLYHDLAARPHNVHLVSMKGKALSNKENEVLRVLEHDLKHQPLSEVLRNYFSRTQNESMEEEVFDI